MQPLTSLVAGDESANVVEQLKACRNQIALLRARVRDLLDTKRQEREEKQSSKDEAQSVKRQRTTRVDTSVAASSDSLSTTDTLPDSSESDDDQDPCDEPNPSPRECSELSTITAWSEGGYHSESSGDVILAGVKHMLLARASDCQDSLSTKLMCTLRATRVSWSTRTPMRFGGWRPSTSVCGVRLGR